MSSTDLIIIYSRHLIVNKAIETNAAVIGLSALMTTTMIRMKDVVEICKEKGCKSKVVIGGACITQSFADEDVYKRQVYLQSRKAQAIRLSYSNGDAWHRYEKHSFCGRSAVSYTHLDVYKRQRTE